MTWHQLDCHIVCRLVSCILLLAFNQAAFASTHSYEEAVVEQSATPCFASIPAAGPILSSGRKKLLASDATQMMPNISSTVEDYVLR
jgi:hypothetical protein